MAQLSLRDFQKQALHALEINPESHVLCVSPTGSGKSRIYENYVQTPGTRAILISPLIALSRQQKDGFLALQNPRLKVSLGMGSDSAGPPDMNSYDSGVWIVSPERLFGEGSARWHQSLRKWKPNFLIVDECHCVWEWGHRFREEYRQVPKLISEFNISKSLWLTATLTSEQEVSLESDIQKPLRKVLKTEVPGGIGLRMEHIPYHLRMEALLRETKSPERTLIFVPSRRLSERLANHLKHFNTGRNTILPYHAGLGIEERHNTERIFHAESDCTLIATSAFGLGMNVPSIRKVILWQPPLSMTTLVQFIGRLGRNSEKGTAIVYWHEDDFHIQSWALKSIPEKQQAVIVYRFLRSRGCRVHRLIEFMRHGNLSQRSTLDGTSPTDKSANSCKRCDYCLLRLES